MTSRPERTRGPDDLWPTRAEIEDALCALLAAIVAHQPPADPAPRPHRGWAERLPGEDFIADPIGRSLREGVKQLGRALYALTGSLAVLSESRERVSNRDPAHADRQRGVLGKCWIGIGSGTARWNP